MYMFEQANKAATSTYKLDAAFAAFTSHICNLLLLLLLLLLLPHTVRALFCGWTWSVAVICMRHKSQLVSRETLTNERLTHTRTLRWPL